MMVVTHEMGFARKVANRVIFMDEGKIVEDADKEAFFANPQSDRAKDFLAKILHYQLFAAHTARYAQLIFPTILFFNIIYAAGYRYYHLRTK